MPLSSDSCQLEEEVLVDFFLRFCNYFSVLNMFTYLKCTIFRRSTVKNWCNLQHMAYRLIVHKRTEIGKRMLNQSKSASHAQKLIIRVHSSLTKRL